MKVKILRNLGKGLPNFFEGEVKDLPKEEAEKLLARGLAEQVPVIEAISKKPTVSLSKEPAKPAESATTIKKDAGQ